MSDELLDPQPDDALLADDGIVPPTYSPGNLPDGEPIIGVPRSKEKFYGPVTGPFAVQIAGDILQTREDWVGYIRINHKGEAYPVHQVAFERHYEIYGVEREASDDVVAALQADLDKANADLNTVESDLAAARAELASANAEIEALEANLDTEREQTGTVPPAEEPDEAAASEAIGVEGADKYNERDEHDQAEAELAAEEATFGSQDPAALDEDEELLQPDDQEAGDA